MKVAVWGGKNAKLKEIDLTVEGVRQLDDQAVVQVLRVLELNHRQYHARTKTRGEVHGGGKKPWRQKGTGRARQGSIRSPLWRGGGVAHGPSGMAHRLKISGRVSKGALLTVLLGKIKEGTLRVLADDQFQVGKTKEMLALLQNLNLVGSSLLFVTDNELALRGGRNLKNVSLANPQSLNLRQMLSNQNIVVTELAFNFLKKRFGL